MNVDEGLTGLNGVPFTQMTDKQIAEAMRALEEAKASRILSSFDSVRDNYVKAVAAIEEAVAPYGLDAERFITMTPHALRMHILSRMDSSRAPGAPRTVKVPPKYRNPENPEQTWTGRGNKPAWVREFE